MPAVAPFDAILQSSSMDSLFACTQTHTNTNTHRNTQTQTHNGATRRLPLPDLTAFLFRASAKLAWLHLMPFYKVLPPTCSTDKFIKGHFYKGKYFTTEFLFEQKIEKKHPDKTCIFPLLVTLLDGFIGQNYVRKLALVSFCNPFIVAPIRAFF